LRQIAVNIDTANETKEDKRAKGQEAFECFTQYCVVLPSGFDYKKELPEYRDERYGHID